MMRVMETPTIKIPAPLQPSPGGQLAPEQILGRDAIIAELWQALDTQSVYVNDLRRIGKTQVMRKMHSNLPAGWHSVKRDLEGCHTVVEFVGLVCQDAMSVLDAKKKTLRRIGKLWGSMKGFEIGSEIFSLKFPDGKSVRWKDLLREAFADIEDAMSELEKEEKHPQRMIFFWDEMPYLLQNITEKETPAVAMEVLDLLRALTQEHNHIRLMLTGSIGLHHVLADLRKEKYNGSPLNHMRSFSLGPLASADAKDLATRLLLGKRFTSTVTPALEDCAQTIAQLAGNVPFYIHKIISGLSQTDIAMNPENIERNFRREITTHANDWHLDHYSNRLDQYYREDAAAARAILDSLARAPAPMKFDALRRDVAGNISIQDDKIREVLRLLCADFYLEKNEDGSYHFYLEIVRHWWRADRDLQ
jgi:hypothetical protein